MQELEARIVVVTSVPVNESGASPRKRLSIHITVSFEWQDLGIRTVVVTSVPVSESGVPTETKEQFSETWDYWPDISDENGTLDIGSIAYFPGAEFGSQNDSNARNLQHWHGISHENGTLDVSSIAYRPGVRLSPYDACRNLLL